MNAVLNHAVGAGYELSSQYPGLEIRFLDIPNVHAVQASFKAVYDLSFSSKTYATGWLSALESTVRQIFSALVSIFFFLF